MNFPLLNEISTSCYQICNKFSLTNPIEFDFRPNNLLQQVKDIDHAVLIDLQDQLSYVISKGFSDALAEEIYLGDQTTYEVSKSIGALPTDFDMISGYDKLPNEMETISRKKGHANPRLSTHTQNINDEALRELKSHLYNNITGNDNELIDENPILVKYLDAESLQDEPYNFQSYSPSETLSKKYALHFKIHPISNILVTQGRY